MIFPAMSRHYQNCQLFSLSLMSEKYLDMDAVKSKHAWLVHITAWAVIFGMPLFVTSPNRPAMTWPEYLRFLLVPVSFLIVFYTNYSLLVERYLFKRRTGRFFICNIILVAAVIACLHLIFTFILPFDTVHPPKPRPWQDSVRFFVGNALLYMLVVGAAVAIKMTGGWYRAEAARQMLEHSRTEAELRNLKSQLNPHFLFNTLNNIYSLIQIDPEKAQQAVHDLGGLLRYVLYDSSRPTVPLRDEINFVRDYIELFRIRQQRHVLVSVSLPENPSSAPVAPLLFIALVENAFKHGVSNDKPSYVTISIDETKDGIECLIRNSYFPKTTSDRSGSGIGLQNLSKRLELIYPGRYTFEYGLSGDTSYQVLLKVRLK